MFIIFADTSSKPESKAEADKVSALVAPTFSTLEKLQLPDALGVRPNFTETLDMLTACDPDAPNETSKVKGEGDPDDLDLSSAPVDLEALIENPLTIDEGRTQKLLDPTQGKKITIIRLPASTPKKTDANRDDDASSNDSADMPLKICDVRTETLPHSLLVKQANAVESESGDSCDGYSDSEDSDDDAASWIASTGKSNTASPGRHGNAVASTKTPTTAPPVDAIDINTILASANNASSILSAAMNTTSSSVSQGDLSEKIQRRIQKATCINCSAMFLDPRDLKKHILSHKKTLYACEICGEKFPTVFLLKKHSRVHLSSVLTMSSMSAVGGGEGKTKASSQGNGKRVKRKKDDDPDWDESKCHLE